MNELAQGMLPGSARRAGAGPTQHQSASYRPDVDALRAIAVMPVVLFHAGIPGFGGGYIGVDVFFVISGFLITGIIARELDCGRFSLLEFYRRRARRIFPALTALVLVTLILGSMLLTPVEFEELGKSVASIAVFGSNVYFWKSASYFDPGLEPLLHTWSLAVEEQFYLFFPLLLVMMSRRRRWLIGALSTILVCSLALSILLVSWKPGAAFYLLPSRAWELMLGGLLALGCFPGAPNGRISRGASLLGLALIIAPIFLYTRGTPFPGLAALPPSLGAALVIWARDEELLAQPVAVSIGLASYSYYLWHLPVIEYWKYLSGGTLSVQAGLLASALSLAIAYVSLRWIEQPFRQRTSKVRANRLALIATGGMFVIGASATSVIVGQGLPGRFSPDRAAQLAAADDKSRHHIECMSLDEKWIDPREACHLGAPVPASVILWGDSHAMITAKSMEAAASRTSSSFLFAANADCPIGADLAIDERFEPGLTKQGHYRRCGSYNRAMLDLALTSPQIKTVVLSSRWTNWRIGEPPNPVESLVDVRLRDSKGTAASTAANREKFEKSFTRLLRILHSAGKRVVIVGPVPEPTYNVPHRLHISSYGFVPQPEPIRMADFRRRHAVIIRLFERLDAIPGVDVIWPSEALCSNDLCPVVVNGQPVFFDHNHLTVGASERIAGHFQRIFAG